MALTVIQPSGINSTGNYTVNSMTITANANIGNIGTAIITATGNITGANLVTGGVLSVNGNANIGNLGTAQVLATANITAPQLISNVATGTAPLVVSSNTVVANLNADLLDGYNTASANTASTIALRDASGNLSANFFIGNGSQLTGISSGSSSNISNGNSNVNIPAANGNVNISAVGNTVMTITGTGANITGTLNTSGNSNVGNLGTAQILATANITSPQLISNVATGTAPLVVTSTTLVPNLYVARANVSDYSAVTSVTSGNFYLLTGSATTGNVQTSANSVFVANASNGAITATTFVGSLSGAATTAGTVTTNSQPNITSTGILSSLSVSGNANVGNIGATNGVFTNVSGNGSSLSSITGANVTGAVAYATTANSVAVANVSGIGNIATVNLDGNSSNILYGNGSFAAAPTGGGYGNSNVATFLASYGSNTITTTGNVSVGNIIGNGASLSSITGANITGAVAYATTANSVAGGNVSGQVSNALVAGTVYTNAQPNITSTGTLTSLSVSGNANVGNLGTAQVLATANITSPQLISNVATGTAPLVVTSTTVVANLNANALQGSTPASANTASTIALRDASGNISANFFIGNGSQLTGIASGSSSNISNGNSNVSIATANGNVTIAAVGNTTMTITGTGANIAGTANITGNLIAGNITAGSGTGGNITGANLVSANYFTGTLTSNAQPNITSIGTLASLSVSGNATVGNLIGPLANGNSNVSIAAANGNVTIAAVGNTTMTITGTGANITGYANITGNSNVGNIGAVQGIFTTSANIPLINSGTSNITLTSGANISTFIGGNATAQFVVTGTGANIAGTANVVGNITAGNISATNGNFTTANVTGQLISTVATGTAPLVVTSTTVVSNLNANALQGSAPASANTASTIALRDASGNLSANFFIGNGSQLTGIASGSSSNISNGNSNVSIPSANGNITMSAVGNANILVVTGTGANITGTANISGNLSAANANLGNLVVANYITVTSNIAIGGGTGGNLTGANVIFANTGNFSANLVVGSGSNGNITGANVIFANTFTVTNSGNITGANVISANTFTVTNFGNITGANVISANNFTLKQYNETVVAGGSTGAATLTPNAAAGTIYTYTLTGNITLSALSSAVAGTSMVIILTQDATGGRTLTSTMKFAGASKTLSTAASAIDIMSVFYDGTTYYATLSKGYA